MTDLLQDVRFAARMLRKAPGFTVVSVLALALGIGANVAIFAVVRGVVLRPLPYADPARLVEMFTVNPARGTEQGPFSPQDLQDLKSQTTGVFEKVSGFWYAPGMSGETLTGYGDPVRIDSAMADSDFFATLGVTPVLGRSFTAEENVAGKDGVVVLSDTIWRRVFHADPTVVGRSIALDGSPFTVIGVMPPSFVFPAPAVEMWTPLSNMTEDMTPHRRGVRWISVVGRLQPGVSAQQAESAATVVMARLARQYPDSNSDWQAARVSDLRETVLGKAKPFLLMLLAAVALVLLIACANVANLLLARGTAREREFAIRSALGAAQSRLRRQLLTESVVLGLAGGATSFLVATWITSGLLALSAGSIPRGREVRMDWSVVLFAALLSVAAGILLGLVPSVNTAASRMWNSLKAAGTAAADPRRQRGRQVLAISEIALACVLLVASSLLLKSLWKLLTTDPGFEARHVLTVQLSIPKNRWDTVASMTSYTNDVLRTVRAIPGVTAAGASKTMPLYGGGEPYPFSISDPVRGAIPVVTTAGTFIVSDGYFEALSIPLIAGRFFDARDFAEKKPFVLINETVARTYWPNRNPVGQLLAIGKSHLVIIGVVGDVRSQGITRQAGTAIYAPMSLMPRSKLDLFLRTNQDPLAIAGAVRQAIHQLNPEQPIEDMAPLEQVVHETIAQPRFFTVVLSAFGAVAILLAALGIFGVISYNVRQRTREIGVRMALGASRQAVLRMVLRQASTLLVMGLAAGLVAALAFARVLRGLLFSVGTADPLALSAAVVTVAVVALAAAAIPAFRAIHVNPTVALRYE